MLRPQSEVEARLREFDRHIEAALERSRKAAQRIAEARSRLSPETKAFLEVSAQQATEDVPLLERLQEVARMPEKVSMRVFHELIKNDLDYEQSKGVERFLALWEKYLQYHTRETYLQYHTKPPQAPDHWSGVGPVTYAPASGGSVVDAVFAKLDA